MFVREPRLGAVKTRLAQTMGEVRALAAYLRLVEHAIAQLRHCPGMRLELWVAGDPDHAQVQQWSVALHARIRTQTVGDLGQRMHAALFDRQQPAAGAVVVGTDCPGIGVSLVDEARFALESGADVALAPAEDGGYGLIAMNTKHYRSLAQAPFSNIQWGSAAVYAESIAACQRLALTTVELEQVWDVDTEVDWQRFLALTG